MNTTIQKEDSFKKKVAYAYRGLMRFIRESPQEEQDYVKKAFYMAKDAHEGVRRKSGEPYIMHPLAVAKIVVSEMGIKDPISIACALLHDTVEDTYVELLDIEHEFGKTARNIIDGLTKISSSDTQLIDELDSTQAANFRKVLLTISDDIRVILIKLADRLHNMRTLGAKKQEKILKTASETLYIYVPLAHRLGLYEIKSEFEDLWLKYSQPLVYKEISEKLEAARPEAQRYIDRFIRGIRARLREETHLKFKIKSRFKSISSIYSKMRRKELPFEEIYDKYAVRIILETRIGKERKDCWLAYSTISGLYQPNPKRLRDWITMPKENKYEALHTTLMGPGGKWVEVQIRSERMDYLAEKGIAAHWRYKENGEKLDDSLTQWISQVHDILENPNLNSLEALREFKENLQLNDVFVFTPKGEMRRMPVDSTVLDFAYKIHTNIGDTAIGAKVNQQVVSLEYQLKAGDQVEIITSKKQEPKKEWLRFVRTARAKDHIKKAVQKKRKETIEQGRRIFRWRASRFQVDEDHPYMLELLAYFKQPTIEDFFFALGTHRIDTEKISEFISLKKEGKEIDEEYLTEWQRHRRMLEARLEEVGVNTKTLFIGNDANIDNYILANCCKPLPGDDILAYDEGDRIVIHSTYCETAIGLMSSFGSKIISAKWAGENKGVSFLAGIKVVGLDKQGMLFDLIRIISFTKKLNIRKVEIESQKGLFEGLFTVYVQNNEELGRLIDRLVEHPNVYTAVRTDPQSTPFLAPPKSFHDE